MNLGTLLASTAVILQIAAALLALRLIRITRSRGAWVLIAIGFCLMSVKGLISLWLLDVGYFSEPVAIWQESLSVAISGVMLAGVLSIFPVFLSFKATQDALQESHEKLEFRVAERTAELSREIEERRKIEEAIRNEQQFFKAVRDAMPAHLAVLDREGTIININKAWLGFARENQGDEAAIGVGVNYLEVCRRASDDVQNAAVALQGIREVLGGQRNFFELEYPCHSPDKKRWYILRVTPFPHRNGAVVAHIDITNLKQAEEAVTQAKEEWELTFNTMPDLIALMDFEYHIVRANRALAEALGVKAEDLIGQHCYEFMHGQMTPPDFCPHAKLMHDSKEHKVEMHALGREFFVTASPFKDKEGRLIGSVQVAHDITERRKGEEALRQQAQIIDQIHDSVISTDLDGYVRFWNKGAERMYGYTTTEALGRHISFLYPEGEEDFLRNKIIGPLREKGWHEIEAVNRTKSGEAIYIHLALSLLRDAEGLATGMISYSQDITERRQSEAALRESEAKYQNLDKLKRLLIDTVPDLIWAKDMGDRFILVNQAMCEKLLGCLNPDEAVGKTDVYFAERERSAGRVYTFGELSVDSDAVVKKNRRPVRSLESGLVRNRYLALDVHKVPFINEDGQIIGTVGCGRDITKEKKTEEALRESGIKMRLLATQLLTAQEAERKRIASELHDELGHALLTWKLNLRSIERQLHPEQQAVADDVDALLQDIDGVVENVRRLYLNLNPGDLEDLGLTAALQGLIEEFAKHHGNIIWSVDLKNIDNYFPTPVQTAIYRVFQEILTNIGKHAEPSRVEIKIRQRNKNVLFTAEDNGKGFDSECIREDAPRNGMGLLTMEERVRMLGGSFKICSKENQGTKITFVIPILEGGK